MMRKILLSLLVLLLGLPPLALAQPIDIPPGVKLPQDSLTQRHLLQAVTEFLHDTSSHCPRIAPEDRDQTLILRQELQRVREKHAHLPLTLSLSDLIPMGRGQFQLELALLVLRANTPELLAMIRLIAQRQEDGTYLFSSPLRHRTREWAVIQDGHLTSICEDSTSLDFARQHMAHARSFDQLLGKELPTTFYFSTTSQNLPDLLGLMGLIHSELYTGKTWSMADFRTPTHQIELFTRRSFIGGKPDPHDIFHSRTYTVIPPEMRNRPMICGCAYLYGGSWGMSWEDILRRFKRSVDYTHITDWWAWYLDRHNFGESQKKYLLGTQFINALIIGEVIENQGFPPVLKLLSSGDMHHDREGFLRVLETVTGINEENFNLRVRRLIRRAMRGI